MIQGTNNDFNSVKQKAQELGLNASFVNNMYSQYGNSSVGKTLCNLLGTSPENLRDDALNIVGGNSTISNISTTNTNTNNKPTTSNKFPRLK